MEKWRQIADLWKQVRFVELSYELEEGMPMPGDLSKYYHDLWSSYELGDSCLSYQIVLNEHTGTHVDAPAHMLGKNSGAHIFIEENPVTKYAFPSAIIDCPKGEREQITTADITDWEAEHGSIEAGEGVFFCTGWERNWKIYDPAQAFVKNGPGLSEEAAIYLKKKGIAAVGIDCPSIDCFGVSDCRAHKALLTENIPVFENLIHLAELPPRCFILSLPLRIKKGTGSPVRVVAVID